MVFLSLTQDLLNLLVKHSLSLDHITFGSLGENVSVKKVQVIIFSFTVVMLTSEKWDVIFQQSVYSMEAKEYQAFCWENVFSITRSPVQYDMFETVNGYCWWALYH